MDFDFIIIILIIQISYVSLFTLRMIFMVKGKKYYASFISIIEVAINITGLSIVLDRLSNPLYLIVYSLGYAIGILVGSKIEEKLALGYLMVQVISRKSDSDFPVILRKKDTV